MHDVLTLILDVHQYLFLKTFYKILQFEHFIVFGMDEGSFILILLQKSK